MVIGAVQNTVTRRNITGPRTTIPRRNTRVPRTTILRRNTRGAGNSRKIWKSLIRKMVAENIIILLDPRKLQMLI